MMTCPVEVEEKTVITLSHGSGGRQTSQLIEQVFLPAFGNQVIQTLHDGALLDMNCGQLAFTTDSYVVQPLFFPGGDIGKLAVTGTVNDLAMCGARPQYLSCGFIIEEGFLLRDLKRIVESMREAAIKSSVEIVTGDTKVVERQSQEPNIFINTSGIGRFLCKEPINARSIREGDAIVLSGDVGRHAMAIMAERSGLSFPEGLESDCAPLFAMVEALLEAEIELHCLRDATRGGVATALVELSEQSGMNFSLFEEKISVSAPVKSACEVLGLDPLHAANEGCFLAFIPQDRAECAQAVLRQFSTGKEACVIGQVSGRSSSPRALMHNSLGTQRYLYKLSGDQLPRIC